MNFILEIKLKYLFSNNISYMFCLAYYIFFLLFYLNSLMYVYFYYRLIE